MERLSNQLYQEGKRVHAVQRELFTPLCMAFREHILTLTSKDVLDDIDSFQEAEIPAPYTDEVFEDSRDLYAQIPKAKAQFWLRQYEEFQEAHPELIPQGSPSQIDLWRQFIAEIEEKNLRDPILDAYYEYNDFSEAQRRKHNEFIGHIKHNAQLRLPFQYPSPYKSFDIYYWALTEVSLQDSVVKWCVVPIGDYPFEFYIKLLAFTKVALKESENSLGELAQDIQTDHFDFITNETARGYNRKRHALGFNAPLATLQEGILSYTAALSLLTAEKVEGFPEPDKLFRQVVAQDLPGALSQIIPMGLLMPYVLRGRYFPSILNNTNGTLRFSSDFLQKMKKTKGEYLHRLYGEGRPGHHATLGTGFGCPVGKSEKSNHDSGIKMIGEAFEHIYNLVRVERRPER